MLNRCIMSPASLKMFMFRELQGLWRGFRWCGWHSNAVSKFKAATEAASNGGLTACLPGRLVKCSRCGRLSIALR